MALRPRSLPVRSSARSRAEDPRVLLGLLGGLGLGDLIVMAAFSQALGIGLALGTGALVVLGAMRERAVAKRARPLVKLDESDGSFYVDEETGLPNRNPLIDQIAREIARAERYQHDLSLAVVQIERLDDLESAWGSEAATKAVAHVAQTLKRITRTSDMLARVDTDRFSVVLMQCSNEQAKKLAERVELAVSNRAIRIGGRMRGVPVYVTARVSTLQYDPTRVRGPLDFLSRAGGEMAIPQEGRMAAQKTGSRVLVRHEAPPAIRRQAAAEDYYPDGEIQDFADAYKAFRTKAS